MRNFVGNTHQVDVTPDSSVYVCSWAAPVGHLWGTGLGGGAPGGPRDPFTESKAASQGEGSAPLG